MNLGFHGVCGFTSGGQKLGSIQGPTYLIHMVYHITSHHITSHRITSHHITLQALHHIASHHITSHHITSHCITSHHIASHHFASITSHCITSHHFASISLGKQFIISMWISFDILLGVKTQCTLLDPSCVFINPPVEYICMCLYSTYV